MRGAGLILAFCAAACGTTDFSKPIADASAPPVDAATGGDSAAAPDGALPGLDGGSLDCAAVSPQPLFCSNFSGDLDLEGFQIVSGSTSVTIDSTLWASPPSALQASTLASSSYTLSSVYHAFPTAPSNSITLSVLVYPDVADYVYLPRAVLLALQFPASDVDVYVDASPTGIGLKSRRGSAFNSLVVQNGSPADWLPVKKWTRLTLRVDGGAAPAVWLSFDANKAAFASNIAVPGGPINGGMNLELGLKSVDPAPSTAAWRVRMDDLVIWAN